MIIKIDFDIKRFSFNGENKFQDNHFVIFDGFAINKDSSNKEKIKMIKIEIKNMGISIFGSGEFYNEIIGIFKDKNEEVLYDYISDELVNYFSEDIINKLKIVRKNGYTTGVRDIANEFVNIIERKNI